MNPAQAIIVGLQLAQEFIQFTIKMQKAQTEGREGLTDEEVATFRAATIAQLALSQTKISNLGKPAEAS